MDDTIIIIRASRCLSIMNIHGARRAGRRGRKACMGWSWAAVCGVQGLEHIVRPRAQLVVIIVVVMCRRTQRCLFVRSVVVMPSARVYNTVTLSLWV